MFNLLLQFLKSIIYSILMALTVKKKLSQSFNYPQRAIKIRTLFQFITQLLHINSIPICTMLKDIKSTFHLRYPYKHFMLHYFLFTRSSLVFILFSFIISSITSIPIFLANFCFLSFVKFCLSLKNCSLRKGIK